MALVRKMTCEVRLRLSAMSINSTVQLFNLFSKKANPQHRLQFGLS